MLFFALNISQLLDWWLLRLF